MNGSLYQNPTFPSIEKESPVISEEFIPINNEAKNIINFLNNNKGKKINALLSYPNSSSWQSKSYEGIIDDVGDDYLLINSLENETRYLLKLKYLDYIEFAERINYH